RPRLRRARDPDLVARDLLAQRRRLEQRQATGATAADVDRHPVPSRWIEDLFVDQADQIIDVQQVADLLTVAPETDVPERTLEVMGEDPASEHALVDLAHLPRAGDHAT